MNHANAGVVPFSRDVLRLNASEEVARIVAWLRHTVHQTLRRQGVVIGVSGGIDSSLVLTLCVQAFGPERVLAVQLPERESSGESARLAQHLANWLKTPTVTEDLTAALEGAGCYRRRDEAIARLFPDYGPGWGAKIVLAGNILEQSVLNVFQLTVTRPDGQTVTRRLSWRDFSQIVAASNFKQRLRMMVLYYHAELRNYAVIGTANKNEHALGFFVKYGDGGVDAQPIAHLYKSQVYQLADHLGLPEEIRLRTPTTDTYPGGSTQEEFFYRLPFDTLDMIWYGREHAVSVAEIAAALQLTPEQVERVISDIASKQRATQYLRLAALTLADPRTGTAEQTPSHLVEAQGD